MNKVILSGNLTKDVEVSTTSNGISVAKFTLAVQRKFKDASGERETDFINIVAWRKLAELLRDYTQKGSKILVVGELQTRNYDAQDGTKRYVTEVIAEEVEFLNTKTENKEDKKDKTRLKPIDNDDLPF